MTSFTSLGRSTALIMSCSVNRQCVVHLSELGLSYLNLPIFKTMFCIFLNILFIFVSSRSVWYSILFEFLNVFCSKHEMFWLIQFIYFQKDKNYHEYISFIWVIQVLTNNSFRSFSQSYISKWRQSEPLGC